MAEEPPQPSGAVRRAMQRARIHFLRAALEVVQGLSAALEELKSAREPTEPDDGQGRTRIELDE